MPCLDCGRPGSSICQGCARHRSKRRGNTTERGYGSNYQKARRLALEGATHCTHCGIEFTIDNPATGGHEKAIRDGGNAADGIAPHCRRCNYGWRRTNL